MSNITKSEISQNVIENLASIEEQIEQTSNYFKPKEGKTYILKIDPAKPITPKLVDKFKGPDGKPVIRYSLEVTHPNTGKTQNWEISKTLCLQVVERLKQSFTVLSVVRTGSDRTTTYEVKGIE